MRRLYALLGGLGSLALLAGLAALALWFGRDLLPPDRLVFAAGHSGGGYARIAERYRRALADDGIVVEIRETAGSVENARLLEAGEVDVALVQGGVEVDRDAAESLGQMFFEPLFVFVRAGVEDAANPAAWRRLRVATGPEGSGARAAAEAFRRAASLDDGVVEALPLGGREAAEALLAGEADAALFVAPISAPYLVPLIEAEGVRLVQLAPVDALARRMSGAHVARLPQGSITMEPPRPAEDLEMIVLTARLAASPDLHPALVDRLVMAARRLHGGRDVLTDAGRFPAVEEGGLPMNPQARRLIESGPGFLAEWLPWWMAAQIDRVLVILLPLLLVLAPAIRIGPALYAWAMKRRVWRFYDRIAEIDADMQGAETREALQDAEARLAELDRKLAALDLPASYMQMAYSARLHAQMLRERLERRLAER